MEIFKQLVAMQNIDLNKKLECFNDHWSPRIIASVNGQEVKLAKFEGAFDWHSHADADEMFLVLDGSFTMEFRDRSVTLSKGQMIVVPKGVEHRPIAEAECSVMLVETAGLVNTGDGEETDRTTSAMWI
jgi:mannose-6-phosphate isomerase-like protein (cupin superfamily)